MRSNSIQFTYPSEYLFSDYFGEIFDTNEGDHHAYVFAHLNVDLG